MQLSWGSGFKTLYANQPACPLWSYSVLNVKALVGAFNQEQALVGAFSMIVKTD